MSRRKLTKEELQSAAPSYGVDPDQSYEELRDHFEIQECRWCRDEFIESVWGKFCSESCQVQYFHEMGL